jgi:hypothetical protein
MADTRKPTPVNLGVKQTPRPVPRPATVWLGRSDPAQAVPRVQSVHMPTPPKSSASVPTTKPVYLGTAKK